MKGYRHLLDALLDRSLTLIKVAGDEVALFNLGEDGPDLIARGESLRASGVKATA